MAENNEVTRVAFAEPISVNVNIPNFEGKAGRDGRDGDDAYRVAVRNGFVGTEKEWLKSLNGDSNTVVPNARTALLNNNLWCKDDKVDSVLATVITNMGKPFPRTEFTPLSVPSALAGQKTVTVTGEPHYKVKISGYDELHEIGDEGILPLALPTPLGEDDFPLEYYNFTNVKVGNAVIKGQADSTATPDDTYEKNGIKYSLFGKTLHANVTGFSGWSVTDPIFLGKWTKEQVDKVLVKASRPVTINIEAYDAFQTLGNTPVLVDNPQNVRFENRDANSTPIQLGSVADGTRPVMFNTSLVIWDDKRKQFIDDGSIMDNL